MSIARRIVTLTGKALLGIVVVIILAYGLLLLVNLNDAEPSTLTYELRQSYESHPVPEDSENAFLVVLGFSALPEDDPLTMGIARRDWMQTAGPDFGSFDDPLLIDYEPRAERPGDVATLAETCKNPDLACLAALDNSPRIVEKWRTSENWLLRRYIRVISMPAFLERGSFDVAAPLPPYHVVLEGQKLLFLETLVASQSGDTEAVRRFLTRDLAFWRSVLRQSDLLITKMVATVAVAKHLKFGNLILRELTKEQALAVLPDIWLEPIALDERSMKRCFTGEWLFSESMIRAYQGSDISPFSNTYYSEEVGLWEKLGWGVVKPLWQRQDSSNRHADFLVNMASHFEVPLADLPYSIAQARAQAESAYRPLSRPYNLVGDFVFSGNGTTMSGYAARVADLEGIRRAAVTLSRLRSEGYGVGDAHGAISDSAIKNPYTELPFEWDEDGRAIVFEGLEEHDRGTHRLPY